jgi:hypothetical protein
MPTPPNETPPASHRSLMSGLDRDASAGDRTGPRLGRFLGRRRTYVVDAAYQLRTALVAVLGMAFLIAFTAALFHLLTVENARTLAQKAPLVARGVSGDTRSVLYLVAAGIVFVTAVFVIEILETHKTAGVVYKVTRGLREIESGLWGTRVALRKHDNFKEMEEAFNSAARALSDAVEEDLRGLHSMEAQARLIAREFEAGNREGALVLLRQIAGELQTLRERKRNMLRSATHAPSGPKI